MIRILSEANYVNKAVSTLVMVVYAQDYRGTTLSMVLYFFCKLKYFCIKVIEIL